MATRRNRGTTLQAPTQGRAASGSEWCSGLKAPVATRPDDNACPTLSAGMKPEGRALDGSELRDGGPRPPPGDALWIPRPGVHEPPAVAGRRRTTALADSRTSSRFHRAENLTPCRHRPAPRGSPVASQDPRTVRLARAHRESQRTGRLRRGSPSPHRAIGRIACGVRGEIGGFWRLSQQRGNIITPRVTVPK